jgi:hypothetical protein
MTGAVHVNPTSLADRAGSRSATHSVSPGALTPLSSCLSLRQARASSALVRAATSVSLCLEPVRYQSTAAPTAATRVEGSRHRSVVQIADVVDADKAAASVTDRLIAGESHPSRRFCQTLGVGRISGKLCSFVIWPYAAAALVRLGDRLSLLVRPGVRLQDLLASGPGTDLPLQWRPWLA